MYAPCCGAWVSSWHTATVLIGLIFPSGIRSAADVGEFTATEEESARLVSRGVLRLGNGYREMGVGAHGFRKGSAWILEAAWLTDFGSDARVL